LYATESRLLLIFTVGADEPDTGVVVTPVAVPPLVPPTDDVDTPVEPVEDGVVVVAAVVLPVTFTSTLLETDPPGPVHVIVNVEFVFRCPTVALCAVSSAPDHAPEPVQLVTFFVLQVSRALPSGATSVTFDVSVSSGALVVEVTAPATPAISWRV
jgi:hypothetical protein